VFRVVVRVVLFFFCWSTVLPLDLVYTPFPLDLDGRFFFLFSHYPDLDYLC